jgi:endo-1,4-beta-xylanase
VLPLSRPLTVTGGFDDFHSWIPGVFAGFGAASLYGLDYEPKPALQAVHNVLKGKK